MVPSSVGFSKYSWWLELSCLLLLSLLSDGSKGLVKTILRRYKPDWACTMKGSLSLPHSDVQTRHPASTDLTGRCAHSGGRPEGVGRLGRVVPTVWLSSSFLSAGLSVWEAAFLLDVGEKKNNTSQLPKASQ